MLNSHATLRKSELIWSTTLLMAPWVQGISHKLCSVSNIWFISYSSRDCLKSAARSDFHLSLVGSFLWFNNCDRVCVWLIIISVFSERNFKRDVKGSCNSILHDIPNREINKLQNVQNYLARVVTRSPRFCSVTPLLKSLHWFPVQFRIKYKICTLTFKVIHRPTCQPVYLHNLLKPSNRTRYLRSSDDDQLVVPRVSSVWVKGLFGLRPPSSGIVSLLGFKNLNLHSHFGKK